MEFDRRDKENLKKILTETRAKIIQHLIERPTNLTRLAEYWEMNPRSIEDGLKKLLKLELVKKEQVAKGGYNTMLWISQDLIDNIEAYNEILEDMDLGEYKVDPAIKKEKGRFELFLWKIISETKARALKKLSEGPANLNQLSARAKLNYKTVRLFIKTFLEGNLVEEGGERGSGYGTVFCISQYLMDNIAVYNKVLVKEHLGKYRIKAKKV